MKHASSHLAPLGMAAVVLAASPAVAALLGVDSVRGWLELTRTSSVVLRGALLCYSVLIAARAIERAPTGSEGVILARSIAAVPVLMCIALLGAFFWSWHSQSTDGQEWALLYACPSAALTGMLGTTGVLLLGRGIVSSRRVGMRAAFVLAVLGVLVYFLMRLVGIPSMPRVILVVSIAVLVAVLLGALACDGTRGVLIRIASGVVSGAIIIALATA